ncbi:hypothetical protein JCM10908_004674 [Rhodotorula pacifica]|uniref:uncharacterized protein n=1 Tax=Rhodotorula pacifica TaxID=1495444 RepID=UPI0031819902
MRASSTAKALCVLVGAISTQVEAASSITAAPAAPVTTGFAKRAPASAPPLTEAVYSYGSQPYKVNPYASGRGPQSGYNICNSTTSGADSQCQTLIVNNASDFCIWGSPTQKDGTIGDDEAAVVAYCTTDNWGARVFPAGAITGLQVLHTSEYIQWTGHIDMTALGLTKNDTGGELDPHGADLAGNPLGGLVYSNGLPGGDNKTMAQVIEWNQFIGAGVFCFKACKDPTEGKFCKNTMDLLGCAYNMPAAYEDGKFLECDSDLQDIVGTYTGADGKTSTYSQPTSLDAGATLPYTPRIPSSSNCVTHESSALFPTSLLGYQSSSAATATSASAANSGSSSGATSGSGPGSTGPSATAGAASAATTGTSSGDLVAVSVSLSLLAGLVGTLVTFA